MKPFLILETGRPLDPLNLLIDRKPKDNLVAVELAPPEGARVP